MHKRPMQTPGTAGNNGFARVEGIDKGNCKITFPALDKDAWERYKIIKYGKTYGKTG